MPLTDKQLEYLSNCNRRWNVKTGATGSGKSFVDIAVTIPKRITSARGEGLLVLIGNTRGTLERNILEPMRTIWPGMIGNIRSDNTFELFGKKCYALGADNKKSVAKIQGATFEYVYGDEVTTWSEEVFQMLKSRLRCEHSHFDGTCNPDSPNHWFKEFLDSDADIFQQSYIIDDGVLPPKVVEELKKEYFGTVYYDRYILGKWALAEGLVYPYFDNVVPTVERRYSQYIVSMDYGTQNPTAMILWGECNGVWYAIREYYHSGRETGRQKTDLEYYEDMCSFLGDILPKSVIIDPSAASFIVLMKQRKKYRVRGADNDVMLGIRNTASVLSERKIMFNDCCKRTIQEFGLYCWDDRSGTDAVIKENDHAMDAVRYFVQTMKLYRPKTEYISIMG